MKNGRHLLLPSICTVDGEVIVQIYVKRQEAPQQTFVTVLYKGYGERRSTVILTPDTVYSAVYANMRSIEDDYRKRKGAFDESVDAEWWR